MVLNVHKENDRDTDGFQVNTELREQRIMGK